MDERDSARCGEGVKNKPVEFDVEETGNTKYYRIQKETWIRVDIWIDTEQGMRCKRFTKYIKGELLIPNSYTRILPWQDWEIIRHYLFFPDKNTIVSIIKLHPATSEINEKVGEIEKLLKEEGYVEEDCY